MKTQCFQTLQEAVSYAANFNQIMMEERQYANSRSMIVEDLDSDSCCEDDDILAGKASLEVMHRTYNKCGKQFNKIKKKCGIADPIGFLWQQDKH